MVRMSAKLTEVWTEKYRPRILKDIHGHVSICRYLTRILSVKPSARPHLLFHGPPGTGKTTLAYAYTGELYPTFSMPLYSMYLNASDERTIEVIRDRILYALVLFALLLIGLSLALGQLSFAEQARISSNFASISAVHFGPQSKQWRFMSFSTRKHKRRAR